MSHIIQNTVQQNTLKDALRQKKYKQSPDAAYALVDEIEEALKNGEAKFVKATRNYLVVGDASYEAGNFSTPSIGELKKQHNGLTDAHVNLIVMYPDTNATLEYKEPSNNIVNLINTSDSYTAYQLASQFNCLEAPYHLSLVGVAEYFHDHTQGPQGAIQAFPGALLRHYAAPCPEFGFGSTFVQNEKMQLNLLSDVLSPQHTKSVDEHGHECTYLEPSVGRLINGYLLEEGIYDEQGLLYSLINNFDKIKVGLHEDIEVPFAKTLPGYAKHKTTQILTSTICLDTFTELTDTVKGIMTRLLRAAYLGTILAANRAGKGNLVLTLIGGGVFHNPQSYIWNAIFWAIKEATPFLNDDMDIYVNCLHNPITDPTFGDKALNNVSDTYGIPFKYLVMPII